ncbi:MAG: WYL domain-containing protein, partial [Mycobacteriaceae bacterium]
MSGVGDRVPRLLALVPYLQAHPGVRIADAAAELGISPAQLRRDLNLLWMCGLPGYGPGELIDLSFEGDTVDVLFDAGMTRPLRLSQAEAGALAVALRALAEVGGLLERDVVERAMAKVEAAAGGAGTGAGLTFGTDADAAADSTVAVTTGVLARAVTEHHALHLRYYTASRDELTERVVEPRRLLVVDGRTYLEAWCRRVNDVRLFRVDRVEDVTVLDERVADTTDVTETDPADPFDLGPDLPLAELQLESRHGWVAEYYPTERVSVTSGGKLTISLRYTDDEWLARLVLGLGAGARVLVPAEVARMVAERAAQALTAY